VANKQLTYVFQTADKANFVS